MLALLGAGLTYSAPSEAKMDMAAVDFFMQTTSAVQVDDKSEVGSTDEIVLMSGVITAIIVVPILVKQRSWR